MKLKVTWIGLGMMGIPMAMRLSSACELTVYARNQEKLKSFQSFAHTTNHLVDSVKDADIVFTMLGYPVDVETVHNTLYPHMKKGSVIIDCTTSDPELAKTLYHQAKSYDIACLDAPVTGGVQGAESGNLMMMVGGDHHTYLKVMPLLNLLAKEVIYIGDAGKGQYAKLANQIAIAGALASLAEAIRFSQSHTLPLDRILTMINGGAAQSYASKVYGPKMIDHDVEATFYLKHFIKDLHLALKVSLVELKTVKLVTKMLEVYTQKFPTRGVQAMIDVID